MIVFVTGGTGLLGGHVLTELAARGHAARALVRRPEAAGTLAGRAEAVPGDLREVGRFEARLAGAGALIHAGACYGEYYRRGAADVPGHTNVEGTAALLSAAERQGVRNVVYVSSAAVLRTGDGVTVDERSPYAEHPDDAYFASKVHAEQEVLRFARAHPHVRVVLLLPTVMLGPVDAGPTPTGAFVRKLLARELRFVLPGWHRIADARDVAWAACEALEKGRGGERYLLGGRRCSVAELYAAVSAASGVPTPTRPIAPVKLLLAARLMALAARVTGRPPPLRASLVRRLQEDFTYDSGKAERELGVRFRPLQETVEDAVRWFQASGTAGARP